MNWVFSDFIYNNFVLFGESEAEIEAGVGVVCATWRLCVVETMRIWHVGSAGTAGSFFC